MVFSIDRQKKLQWYPLFVALHCLCVERIRDYHEYLFHRAESHFWWCKFPQGFWMRWIWLSPKDQHLVLPLFQRLLLQIRLLRLRQNQNCGQCKQALWKLSCFRWTEGKIVGYQDQLLVLNLFLLLQKCCISEKIPIFGAIANVTRSDDIDSCSDAEFVGANDNR